MWSWLQSHGLGSVTSPTLIATLPRRRRVIVDCWRIIDRAQLEPITQVIYVGADRTTEQAVAASRSEP